MKSLVSLVPAIDKNKDLNVSHALLRALLHGTCMPAPLNTMCKRLLSEPASSGPFKAFLDVVFPKYLRDFQCLTPMDALFPKPFPVQRFVQPVVYCECYTMFQADL